MSFISLVSFYFKLNFQNIKINEQKFQFCGKIIITNKGGFYMNMSQAERFYAQDKKKYDVLKNKELLTWLNNAIKNGYRSFTDIEDLQGLIDSIVYWYEMKYPNSELDLSRGISDINFVNIEPLSNVMTLRQLMYRLPHRQLCLIECEYRSSGGYCTNIYNEKGEIVECKSMIGMNIDKKWVVPNDALLHWELPYFPLHAETISGIVTDAGGLEEYIGTDNITLDELLTLLKEKCADTLDFTKLEQCIYDHNCDMELRRRILQLAALKLLYSYRTNPEYGYERAKRFIAEFNTEMGLNLSIEEIDEAFSTSEPKAIAEDEEGLFGKVKRFVNPFAKR